jgi:hypothetical protein
MEQASTSSPSNVELSKQLQAKGNEAFKAKNYGTAITHYTAAIDHDPTNHLLYSNRAAAYQCLKNYNQALRNADQCIHLAPQWPKGYFRKGQAFVGLRCPNQAYKYLSVSLSLAKEPAERAAILSEIHLTVLIANQQLTSSLPVEIKYFDEHKGRGLIAKTAIKEGEVILQDVPLVSSRFWPIEEDELSRACHYCFKSLVGLSTILDHLRQLEAKHPLPGITEKFREPPEPVICEKCGLAHYCSTQCRDKAWSLYHRKLCTGGGGEEHPLNQLFKRAAQKSTAQENHLYIVDMITKIIASQIQRLDLPLESGSSDEESLHSTPQGRWDIFWLFSCPSVGTIWQDPAHNAELTFYCQRIKEALYDPRLPFLFSTTAFEQMFKQISYNALKFMPRVPLEDFCETEGITTSAHVVTREMAITHRYLIPLPLRSPSRKGWPGGCEAGGLYVMHSLVNHSDDANAVVANLTDDHTLTILATRDIRQGDEITIDYFIAETEQAEKERLKQEWII